MEKAIVSARAKGEYVQAIYHRYRHAGRPEKRRILDEFCQVAGYHRKHAIRLLNGPAPGAGRPARRRAATYCPAASRRCGPSGRVPLVAPAQQPVVKVAEDVSRPWGPLGNRPIP